MNGSQSPAGLLANFYAARHDHRQYLNFAVTCTYTSPPHAPQSTAERFTSLLKYALRKTISRHPSLCYGIERRTPSSAAYYKRLPFITWPELVTSSTSASPVEGGDLALSRRIEDCHQQAFSAQHWRPAWKLVLLFHQGTQRVDVIFVCHHAIGDGTSGAAFHKTLYQELSLASSLLNLDAEWPYVVPEDIPWPTSLEQAIPYPTSGTFSLTIPEASTTTPYTFTPPLKAQSPHHVDLLTIPGTFLARTLTYCRTQRITLTGYLHGLIMIHLSRKIPSALAFSGATPFSMRRYMNTSPSEIVNQISLIACKWDTPLLNRAHSAPYNSPEESEVILQTARQYQAAMNAELDAVPLRGSLMLAQITAIEDFDAFCRSMTGGRREHTYELSNIGAVDLISAKVEEAGRGLKFQKLVFSQGAMPVGPAFSVNVVSVRGGPLVLCFAWQDGVVDEKLVLGLRDFVEVKLLGVSELGK